MTSIISAAIVGLVVGLWQGWQFGFAAFFGKLTIDTWGEVMGVDDRVAKLEVLVGELKRRLGDE